MATFDDFVTNWKTAVAALAQKNYSDFLDQAKSDADDFLNEAKSDLTKWTALLVQKQIDKDEFESLLQSDADLLELHSLKQAGLAEARWDMFTNSILQTTVSVAVSTFL